MRKDLGDFQTPPELAAALVRRLGPIGPQWPRVLEPTCGRGAFLSAVLDTPSPPREAVGVELQATHCDHARAAVGPRASILQADVFSLDLRAGLPWSGGGPLLVIGNPPWITNAELGRLGSDNLPPKRNVKNLAGLDARTGAANFDLGEAVWLKLIAELADQAPTIALLCKTAVARAVLDHLRRVGPPIASAELIEIDARRWFDAAVGACFLTVTLGGRPGDGRIDVYASPESTTPARAMGVVRGRFANDLDRALRSEFAIGESALDWRQGVKHDAAAVMELTAEGPDGPLRNGLGQPVDVEPERLHPLVKGADLKVPASARPRRALILPQHSLGDDTRELATSAPRLWVYLNEHAARLAARRSSIYRNRPPFAIFGVGPYTFAPYKAVVAGVHRPTRFRAVGPVAGRPTVLDDTCYLVPCRSGPEAAAIAALGNDPITLDLLSALTSPDAKRPVTKDVLRAIAPAAVLARTDRRMLVLRGVDILRDDLGWSVDDGDATLAVEIALERLAPLLSRDLGPTLDRAATTRRDRPPPVSEVS